MSRKQLIASGPGWEVYEDGDDPCPDSSQRCVWLTLFDGRERIRAAHPFDRLVMNDVTLRLPTDFADRLREHDAGENRPKAETPEERQQKIDEAVLRLFRERRFDELTAGGARRYISGESWGYRYACPLFPDASITEISAACDRWVAAGKLRVSDRWIYSLNREAFPVEEE